MTRTLLLTTLAATWFTGCSDAPEMEIGDRMRGSPALRSVDSCNELEQMLHDHIKEEMRVRLLQTLSPQTNFARGGVDVAMAAEDGGAQSSGRQEGVDYSGTNNQEAGVDEADFVKTDGDFIYVLNGNRLEILGVPQFGELTEVSTTTLEGHPSQMLIGDDRAVIFSWVSSYELPEGHPLRAVIATPNAADVAWWYPAPNLTKITVLDIADRSRPTLMHELYLEGSYQTARKVQSSVRMVSYVFMEIPGLLYYPRLPDSFWQEVDWVDYTDDDTFRDAVAAAIRHNNRVIDATPLEELLPAIFQRVGDDIVQHPFTDAACSSFAVAEDAVSRGFTSIISLNLLDQSFSFDADHVLSNWPVVYASLDTLVLAEPAQDWWWYWGNDRFLEAANLHRFDTSVIGETTYTGSGRVNGTIQNQFSLSEYEGFVRVAATTGQWGRWWLENPAEPESHVYVLGGNHSLDLVGYIGGIAKGEQIWSARFVGDKAYLVTFRNIDPLWTIDMTDPSMPLVIGELEVPGVSTYIHPVDDATLLTIGFDGDWRQQVSLFDVSDFATPLLADTHALGSPSGNDWVWSWSEAVYEHKAFQFWPQLALLAVPVATYRYGTTSYEYFSRLELINVDVAGNLSRHGFLDHSPFYDDDGMDYWYNPEVRRSIFMGEFIYAVSDRAVTAHRIADMSLSAAIRLPGSQWGYYGWR